MCHSFFVLHLYCKSIIEKRKNGGYEDVKEERIRQGIQSVGGQVRQKPWISKSSSRGAANPCQHAVRLDTKGKEPLCIPTVAASIPVLHIGQSFKNMALCRA